MATPAGRVTALAALATPLAAGAAFFAVARGTGAAPPLAVWGGAVWVFLLSGIITLPLIAGATAGRRSGEGPALSPMALALGIALCAVPFVFLLIVPWLGLGAALWAALAVVAGIALVCWRLCAGRARPPLEARTP